MPYQKLTYSGTECNNYLYFCLYTDYFDVEIVTKALQLEPTSVKFKQNPVPKATSWKYRINAGAEINLEKYLEMLISIFEPKIDEINKLKENLKLETYVMFVIDIDINPEASTPYFGLNNRTISFLHKTGSTVHFDLYKADTIGLLKNLNVE